MAYSIEDINNKKPEGSWLTVTGFVQTESKFAHVSFICKCGEEGYTRMTNVINGHTWSCGCQRKGNFKKFSDESKKSVKYSEYHKKIGSIYRSIICRCYNEKDTSYKNYGAKGVTMCDEWKNDYQKFLTWCLENGYKEGLNLDKDTKSGITKIYSPETCIFITPRENLLARDITVKVMYKGELQPISKIAEVEGVPYYIIFNNKDNPKFRNIEHYIESYKKYKERNG